MAGSLGRLILHAYDIIGDFTPISADCGQLCENACCKGSDDVGMLLFPGEAMLLAGKNDFKISRINYMDGREWLLSCKGKCSREWRPLSCRIFPLAPIIEANGRILTQPDPRAMQLCPLYTGEFLDAGFKKQVSKAMGILARNPKMLKFMQRLSTELIELRRFTI